MEHTFNTNVASRYDVNIAILLNYFKQTSEFHQGRESDPQWHQTTHEGLCKLFPYWSSRKIKTLFNKLIKFNLIELRKSYLNVYVLTPLATSLYSHSLSNGKGV